MSSTRPYLIRAIYDWALNNGFTPHLLVDTSVEQVVVPTQFIENNSIVLNVNPGAVRDLNIGDDFISFSARFAGAAHEIFVPVVAVRAVYAKENGEGIVLPPGEGNSIGANVNAAGTMVDETSTQDGGEPHEKEDSGKKDPPRKRPHLKIVD